jgi:hypothetical protein
MKGFKATKETLEYSLQREHRALASMKFLLFILVILTA